MKEIISINESKEKLNRNYGRLANQKTIIKVKSLLKTINVPVEFREKDGIHTLKATIGSANSYSEIYLDVKSQHLDENRIQIDFIGRYGLIYRVLMYAIMITTIYLAMSQLYKIAFLEVSLPNSGMVFLNLGISLMVSGLSIFIYIAMLKKYMGILKNLYIEKMNINISD